MEAHAAPLKQEFFYRTNCGTARQSRLGRPTMKILIIKLGALGDVINTLPAVIRIKHHFNSDLHWLCAPLSFPILRHHPAVDRTIVFDRKKKGGFRETLAEIRREKYDLTVDFQRTIKSGFFCLISNSRCKLGFDRKRCKEFTWLYPFSRIPSSEPGKHMVEQYLDFADYLGVPDTDVQWQIRIHEFTTTHLPENYVVLNIGATKKANLWQPEKFAELAVLLHAKEKIRSVMTGGTVDTPMAIKIKKNAKDAVIDLTGRTSLDELTGVINNAAVVVSCDTGPMHLSVALGKKTIGLFGPSNPRRTGPYKGEVIQKNHPCSPCNKKKCSTPLCMQHIMVEDVFKCIMEVMKSSTKPADGILHS